MQPSLPAQPYAHGRIHSPAHFQGEASVPESASPPFNTISRLAPRHASRGKDVLAQALGWFSIGAGVAAMIAPRRLGHAAGVAHHPILLRAVAAREIASGIGILSQPRNTGWMWSRVAGDAMDLAMLALAASEGRSAKRRKRLAIAGAAVVGIAALDVLSSVRRTRQLHRAIGEVDVEKSIVVNRPPEVCYRYWRNMRNFPSFMRHVEEVSVLSDTRSHWRAKAPAGMSAEWDAEISVDHPNQLLAWHSVGEGDIDNAGTVRFEPAPGGRGTILRIELQYKPPAGQAGALIAKLFGEEPSQQIDEDLRRFKQLVETGEIATTEGQPSGPRGLLTRLFFRHAGEQR